MPCLLAILALFIPRVVIVLLVIFSDYIGRGFQGTPAYPLIPLLGFIFMPITTLAYALAMNENNRSVDGLYLVVLILAVLLDLGVLGGGERARRTRYRVVRVERRRA
jgi:hypothetical protein